MGKHVIAILFGLVGHVLSLSWKNTSAWYVPLIYHKEYVILFDHYREISKWNEYFNEMNEKSTYSLSYSIEKRNKITYPTDFIVVILYEATMERFIWLYNELKWLKSIYFNQKYKIQSTFDTFQSLNQDIVYTSHMEEWGMPQLWRENITGHHIKVAIFDTGLDTTARKYFHNVQEIINWTDEPALVDTDGHGSFVAGVLASTNPSCPGMAPDVELYAFRVFTSTSTSYTSWLLDALNYALFLRIDVINFSFGGPDFHDTPFVDKIHECAANNIAIISAVGNAGPNYGTLTNPADQIDVLGIGGLAEDSTKIAPFSSRGMTLWEISSGYGRVKPDGIAPATFVQGLTPDGQCRVMNGTSMAAPLVTGMVAILLSRMTESQRILFGNIGFLKSILMQSATRLPSDLSSETINQTAYNDDSQHIYMQGPGSFHLAHAIAKMDSMMASPQATLFPSSLNLTDCPYMWPHCLQPLYHTMLPTTLNLTMFHPTAVTSRLLETPTWIPMENGEYLSIQISTGQDIFWPYSGAIGVHIQVTHDVPRELRAHGEILFTISDSPPIRISVVVALIPTPPRTKRVLWDQYRNVQYPPAYIPSDNLQQTEEPFDAQGDHMHTNHAKLWMQLRSLGYHVELLTQDYSCVDLTQYGTLFVVDPEEPWFPREIAMVHNAMEGYGLNLIVIADWYSDDQLEKMQFWDGNTLSTWFPVMGGANVPALNELLAKYSIRLSQRVWSSVSDIMYMSGTALVQLPSKSWALFANLTDDNASRETTESMAIAGFIQVPFSKTSGHIAIFGDSSCVDATTVPDAECQAMIASLFAYATTGIVPPGAVEIKDDYVVEGIPTRRKPPSEFVKYSKVLNHEPACQSMENS